MKTKPQLTSYIRVSCAVLCRITLNDKFLLLLNHNRRGKGIYQLSPIGGALEVYDLDFLAQFDALLEKPDNHDLRFTMPSPMLGTFRQWFKSGQGRESSPFRELHEELVLETGIMPKLSEDDVEYRLFKTVERAQETDRHGQTGVYTHYFLEIYDVKFTSHHALGYILSAPHNTGAQWLTAEEVKSERPLNLFYDGEQRQVTVRARVLLTDADFAESSSEDSASGEHPTPPPEAPHPQQAG